MDYIKYVNIKQGTRSSVRFSNGNTLPLVQMPFGFVSFAPQTDSSRGSWFYHPDDRSFEGVRLTRQPSPWIGDHGAFVLMPQIQDPTSDPGRRWSSFRAEETVLTPCYLRYVLNRSFCTFELAPSVYGAHGRIKFDKDYPRYLSVLPVSGYCEYRYDPSRSTLYCMTDCDTFGGMSAGVLRSYMVIRFPEGAVDCGSTIVEDAAHHHSHAREICGENTAIHLALNAADVDFQISCSFISFEQAIDNTSRESLPESLEKMRAYGERIWNERLGCVEIEADEDTKKTFYSCMYRAFLYPHRAFEISDGGKPIHYSPGLERAVDGYRYTDNGFWDTYRTNYAFYSIVAQEECAQMIEGYINDYKEYGWFPCWTAGTAKKCMPSTAIDAIITDCAAKGLIKKDNLRIAFSGMEKHANTVSDNPVFGREGCADYCRLGYVPCDKYGESVNLTLDAAYFDNCLADVACMLGETEKEEFYRMRAKNYRNLFDPSVSNMRPRRSDGSFKPDFSPIRWGGDYTEAAAAQTTFAVQHDPEGLASMFGGGGPLLIAIDDLFSMPKDFLVGGYGQEIHEMSEMAAADLGQCAISNQPSFHIPFFPAYFGERELTGDYLKKICKEAFSYRDDGFPGDEDNGSMAIWYIFACIGLYPFCPGKPYYTCHDPLVKSVRISGKRLALPDDVCKISHDDLMKHLIGT